MLTPCADRGETDSDTPIEVCQFRCECGAPHHHAADVLRPPALCIGCRMSVSPDAYGRR